MAAGRCQDQPILIQVSGGAILGALVASLPRQMEFLDAGLGPDMAAFPAAPTPHPGPGSARALTRGSLARGRGWPRLVFPGFRDMRGYRAMYRDFVRAIREERPPEMSLERAIDDHRLMDQIYASLDGVDPGAGSR